MRPIRALIALALTLLTVAFVYFVFIEGDNDGFVRSEREELAKPDVAVPCIVVLTGRTVHTDTECAHLDNLKEENYLVIELVDVGFYIEEGYKYCKSCSSDYIK